MRNQEADGAIGREQRQLKINKTKNFLNVCQFQFVMWIKSFIVTGKVKTGIQHKFDECR